MRLAASLASLALALALALALGLAGCDGGSGDEPSESRPDDFAFTFVHSDGSVPPPFHAEWSVRVEPDGRGSASFTPDYSGDGVPTYKSSFEVSDEDMDAIYAEMRDAGLLEEIGTAEAPPIGGSIETATIYADGETFDVPAFDESGGAPLSEVSGAVKALVPAADWRSFERRRDAYAEREYGEKP